MVAVIARRDDEAIHFNVDCFATLAMTAIANFYSKWIATLAMTATAQLLFKDTT